MADNLTKILQEAIERKKSEREYLDVKMFAKEFSKELAKSISPDNVSKNIELQISKSLVPLLQKLIEKDSFTADAIANAISSIKIPDVYIPEIKVPEINVPQPKVNVFPPEVKVPPIVMPKEMDIKGWVSLMGVDLQNPLPVQLRDAKGNPVNLLENLTSLVSSGGGGGFKRVRVDNPSTEPVNVQIVSGASATSAVNVVDSSGVGYSGSNPLPVTITSGASATTAVYNLNAEGTYRDTFPVEGTVAVSGITNTTATNIVDSTGVGYSGSNPLPISETVVRGSIYTAYATLTNGTETTLKSAVAGSYLDLIYIMGANDSDASVLVDIRSATAGNKVMTMVIPAQSTAGIACPIPLKQDYTGNNWTADMGDITGTNVYLTAQFKSE